MTQPLTDYTLLAKVLEVLRGNVGIMSGAAGEGSLADLRRDFPDAALSVTLRHGSERNLLTLEPGGAADTEVQQVRLTRLGSDVAGARAEELVALEICAEAKVAWPTDKSLSKDSLPEDLRTCAHFLDAAHVLEKAGYVSLLGAKAAVIQLRKNPSSYASDLESTAASRRRSETMSSSPQSETTWWKRVEIGVIVTVVLALIGVFYQYGQLSERVPSREEYRGLITLLEDREQGRILGDKGDKGDKGNKGDRGAQGSAGPGVEPGTIMAFAGPAEQCPEGWLVCDGQSLATNEFSELEKVLRGYWGNSQNEAPTFKVPDLRGHSLRGVDERNADDGEGVDPDRPRTVGSEQESGTAQPREEAFVAAMGGKHTHLPATEGSEGDKYFEVARGPKGRIDYQYAAPTSEHEGHEHTISGGDNETRPVNVGVNWIIKS